MNSMKNAGNGLKFTSAVMKARGGFTLIELMITVAIVAILAAIAYPSYRDSVDKGRRAEARANLTEAAQWMERFYAENYRYDQTVAGTASTTTFSKRFTQSPKPPGAAAYTLSLDAGSLTQSTASVVAQRTGVMSGDKCGDFVITHQGVKALQNYNTTKYASESAAIADCWK